MTGQTRETRVVVTGAQGFLGRNLVAGLLGAGVSAVLGVGRSPVLDDRFTHELSWLGRDVPAHLPSALVGVADDPRYRYARVDLTDVAATSGVLAQFAPDVVVHAAASLRDTAWDRLVDANLRAVHGLCGALSATPEARLVLVSSGSVYGAARGAIPAREDGPLEPTDLYGATKRAGEDVARILSAGSRRELVCARVFNLVGAGLQERHLPALVARRLAEGRRRGQDVHLELGSLEATRDVIDVRDAAAAITLLSITPMPPAVVNVASGIEVSMSALVETLVRTSGVDATVRTGAPRPGDIPRMVADVTRLQSLGFHCEHPLEHSLASMLTYFDGA